MDKLIILTLFELILDLILTISFDTIDKTFSKR